MCCSGNQVILEGKMVFQVSRALSISYQNAKISHFQQNRKNSAKSSDRKPSPLGTAGPGPVPCSRCPPARRFRNTSLLPGHKGGHVSLKSQRYHPPMSNKRSSRRIFCMGVLFSSLKLVGLKHKKREAAGQGHHLESSWLMKIQLTLGHCLQQAPCVRNF